MFRKRRCGGLYFFQFASQGLLQTPQIMILLHPQPEPGTIADQFADPQRHFRGDGVRASQNPMQLLARNAESPGRLAD